MPKVLEIASRTPASVDTGDDSESQILVGVLTGRSGEEGAVLRLGGRSAGRQAAQDDSSPVVVVVDTLEQATRPVLAMGTELLGQAA